MLKNIKYQFLKLCHIIELLMSFALILVIILYAGRLIISCDYLLTESPINMFDSFMANIMTMAVGVELVKMLAEHNAATIIEVLMFAIARQMVIAHGTSIDIILGVVAIAILFATRKYLFEDTDTTDFE